MMKRRTSSSRSSLRKRGRGRNPDSTSSTHSAAGQRLAVAIISTAARMTAVAAASLKKARSSVAPRLLLCGAGEAER